MLRELSKVIRLCQTESVVCEAITFTQFSILDFVREKGTLEMSELHRLLAVEKSTTTRLVEPLVKRDLLKKVRALHDSRAVELVITDEGKSVYERVWSCIAGFLEEQIQEIPEKERLPMFKGMNTFISSFLRSCKDDTCCK